MGIMKMVVGAAVVFSLGGAVTYVNANSGDTHMAQKALGFGFQQTADMSGEVAKVPGQVVTAVKPGITDLTHQAGGLLGSTATTIPNWDQRADPTTATSAP